MEPYDLTQIKLFLGKSFSDDDGSQNMFAYQAKFVTLKLKVNKSTEYVIG